MHKRVTLLTLRLRHAGPMMFDCQPRCEPRVAWSRFVRRIINDHIEGG
jgi:hypothetical protein